MLRVMQQRFPPFYAIVDAETLARHDLPLRAFVEELLAGGVTLLQYRDKASGPQAILRACAEISAVFAGTPSTLILNDRADLAALASSSTTWGVHVGQDDLLPVDARAVLGTCATVGVSTHTPEQVRQAHASEADYLAIGPVFATQTKLDAEPVTGLETLRQARALTRKPLVAIGGITLENCQSVVDAGADCVAVIGGLFVPGRSVRKTAEDFLARLR